MHRVTYSSQILMALIQALILIYWSVSGIQFITVFSFHVRQFLKISRQVYPCLFDYISIYVLKASVLFLPLNYSLSGCTWLQSSLFRCMQLHQRIARESDCLMPETLVENMEQVRLLHHEMHRVKQYTSSNMHAVLQIVIMPNMVLNHKQYGSMNQYLE